MAEELRVGPVSSEAARAEIERTRARLSETIDEIEETILRTRDDLKRKLDVLGRVRERPLESVGVALAAGLILGLLTGGGRGRPVDRESARRAERWEARARRLLSIAREQEQEVADLRALLEEALLALEDRDREEESDYEGFDEEEPDDEPSWLAGVKDSLSERVEDLVATLTTTVMDALRRPPKRKRGR